MYDKKETGIREVCKALACVYLYLYKELTAFPNLRCGEKNNNKIKV